MIMTINDQFDLLGNERRRAAIGEIIAHFKTERGEEIGVIAAEKILDLVILAAGNSIYNRGVQDAKTVVNGKLEDLNIDIESLLRDEPHLYN